MVSWPMHRPDTSSTESQEWRQKLEDRKASPYSSAVHVVWSWWPWVPMHLAGDDPESQKANSHITSSIICPHMLDWEEKLCTHLGLTAVDIHDIKARHQNNPELQR